MKWGPGAVVKAVAWEIGDGRLEAHSDLQVSKKQKVSSPLTRKDTIFWGASVTER